MSISRLLCLVALCLLLSLPAFCADTPAAQEAMPVVIRDITLSPWKVSLQPTFGSESEENPQLIGVSLTRQDTFEILPLEISYTPAFNRSFVVAIPYVRRREELSLGEESIATTDSGLGDIELRTDYIFRPKHMAGWDGSFGFDLTIPTGKSIYDNLGENELPMGVGHYGTGIHLNYRRISDPAVVNFGVGILYSWPRECNGEKIRPGFGFTAKTGIGYALSDRWIMTEELEFTRQPNVFLQSAFTATTETLDQAYITHSFLYNRSPDSASYSLQFSLGLNNQSTDFIMTFGRQR